MKKGLDCIFLPVLYLLEIIFWHIKLWHFFFNQGISPIHKP